MTSKDMGSIVLASGTLKVTVFYDDSFVTSPGYIPSAAESIVSLGDITEKMDVKVGMMEIADFSIQMIEDFSQYPEGLWNRMFKGSETQFRFYIDEGAGDTFLFWGTLNKKEVKFDELYIGSDGKMNRKGSVSLVSLLKKIKDVPVSDVTNDLMDYRLSATFTDNVYSHTYAKYIKAGDIFKSAMFKAFGGSWGDYGFTLPSNNDLLYKKTVPSTSWVDISSLYIAMKYGFPVETKSSLFTGASSMNFAVKFANSLELIGHLCRMWGYIPRYTYDIATVKHTLELIQRGRNNSFAVFGGRETKSSLILENEFRMDAVQAVDRNGYTDNGFDGITFFIDFLAGSALYAGAWDQLLYTLDGTTIDRVGGFRIYDYVAGATIDGGTAPFTTNPYNVPMVSKYYQNRCGKSGAIYEREYMGIAASLDGGSTFSHTNCVPAMRTQISDGAVTRTMYANEVRKSISKNKLYIKWIEE